jgi:hypothetical protein
MFMLSIRSLSGFFSWFFLSLAQPDQSTKLVVVYGSNDTCWLYQFWFHIHTILVLDLP